MGDRLTVIIATCGRPERLPGTLDSVAAAIAAAGDNHAVVVVDNGPHYDAAEVVSRFAEQSPFSVTYKTSSPRDKSKALNTGIDTAETPWLAFTDDDTIPGAGWLTQGMRFAQSSGLRIFGGRIIPGEAPGTLPVWLRPGRSGRAPHGGVNVSYDPMERSGVISASAPVPYGANLFACRDVFEAHGKYDETLWSLCGKAALGCEDCELAVRVRNHGERIGFCREASVTHPYHGDRSGFGTYIKLAYYYGWRDPLVFFDPNRPAFEKYQAGRMIRLKIRTLADLFRGDVAGAATGVCEMAMCVGNVAGRLSSAYRKWAKIQEVGTSRWLVRDDRGRSSLPFFEREAPLTSLTILTFF